VTQLSCDGGKWAKLQSSLIPSRTIVEGEIVACAINCLVAEAKWVESQSNRGTWACVYTLK